MATIDYKEKYNKLVKAVKVLQETSPSDEGIQNWVNDNVPELKESENERIRKLLLYHFGNKTKKEWNGMPVKDILAWLEKQGEQKLAWSEEDEKIFNTLSRTLARISSNTRTDSTSINYSFFAEIDWLKSIKDRMQSQPKQEWSEENEDILNTIINHFEIDLECTENDDIIKWLKSIKPQNRWKPSDEQIHAFEQVYDWYNNNFASSETLTSLYSDLKKLKGK